MISKDDIINEFKRYHLSLPGQLLGSAYEPFLIDAYLARPRLKPWEYTPWIDANREQLKKQHLEYEKLRMSRLLPKLGDPHVERNISTRPSKSAPPRPSPSALALPANTSAFDDVTKADNRRTRSDLDRIKRKPLYAMAEPRSAMAEPSAPKRQRVHPANQHIVALLPTPQQAQILEAFGDAVRVAWNVSLDHTKATHAASGMFVGSAGELTRYVMANRPECCEAPYDAIHGVCNELFLAVRRYMTLRKGANAVPFPAHRKWQHGGRYLAVARVVTDPRHGRIKLPKLGWIAANNLDSIPDQRIKRAKIAQHGAHWNAMLTT